MKVSKFIVNPIGENTYILWNGEASDAAIVDPGMMNSEERDAVDGFVKKNRLSVKMVLMTHLHFDHAASARYVADKYGVKVYAAAGDEFLGSALPEQTKMFNIKVMIDPLMPDVCVNDGDELMLNDEKIVVLGTPGHTPGGLAFYLPESGVVFVGDTLFQMSIGRTDLPGGDYGRIIDSIKNKLYSLPDETVVLPGHGDSTTVGDEKCYNPFTR